MLLTYNWQILDFSIPSSQPLSKYLSIPKVSSTQPLPIISTVNSNQSLPTHPITLKSPCFSFLFSYIIQQPKNNLPQIHLFPQVMLFDSKIQLAIIQQRKQKNYIYQYLKIQNCECYDNMIRFMMRIKYINGQNGSVGMKINNIEKLINLVGSRKLNSHSLQTYAVIKKQISIEQPFIIDVKYNPKGYISIKLTRPEDFTTGISIHSLQILTWLCSHESIKYYESKNMLELLSSQKQQQYQSLCSNKIIQLYNKQSYVWMFNFPQNLNTKNVMKYYQKIVYEIPYSIVYSVNDRSNAKNLNETNEKSHENKKKECFKIIKVIKIQ